MTLDRYISMNYLKAIQFTTVTQSKKTLKIDIIVLLNLVP